MDASEVMELLGPIEEKLGHRFAERSRLVEALTHSSWAHEQPDGGARSNERLEFLGDAVLELAVSHLLHERFPDMSEGGLTRFRAALVNRSTLADKARDLGLGEKMLLGRGEDKARARLRQSILADALEAVLGALFLDGGFEAAFRFVEETFSGELAQDPQDVLAGDFKTLLQEKTHSVYGETPSYRVEAEEGPDHKKSFTVSVHIREELLGVGRGGSKKEAQQMAARKALARLGEAS